MSTNGKPKVYSYARFSTPEQKKGDSRRRQDDGAKAWADRNGHLLDDSLRMTDEGLSGYHGTHRTRGAMGRFLKRVEAEQVSPGSILLVENVDRLGREGPSKTLRKIIFELWDHGITLQTLSPEDTYEPGCENEPKFIVLMLYLQRAYDESKRKSERVRAARDWARKEAHREHRVLTRQVPAWLTANGRDSSRSPGRLRPSA